MAVAHKKTFTESPARVRLRELIACCPGCKTLETVLVSGHRLLPVRRFRQELDGQVYHDCGTGQPCHLFRLR